MSDSKNAHGKLFIEIMDQIKFQEEESALKFLNIHSLPNELFSMTDQDGRDFLIQSIIYTKNKITRFLIIKGANPNLGHYLGFDSLYYALQMGDRVIIDLLIERGANIYRIYENGKSVREVMSESSFDRVHELAYQFESFKKSSGEGIDIDEGFLDIEAIDDHLESKVTDKKLPENNSHLKKKLSTIVLKGEIENENKGKINDRRSKVMSTSSTDLGVHIVKRDPEDTPSGEMGTDKLINFMPEGKICDIELSKSMDFLNGGTNEKGQNILMLACQKGDFEKVKKLVAHGIDFNTLDYKGDGCLSYAVWGGSSEVLEYLLKRGVSTKTKNNLGVNALFYALKSKNLEMFKLLLENGSTTKVKFEGIPLVSWVIKKEMIFFLKELLDFDVDLMVRDIHYKKPMDYAGSAKDKRIKFLLERYQEKKQQELEENRSSYLRKKPKDSDSNQGKKAS